MKCEYVPPLPASVKSAVVAAGGVSEVAKHLKKTDRAIYYWMSGKREIDYANWVQLSIMANSHY